MNVTWDPDQWTLDDRGRPYDPDTGEIPPGWDAWETGPGWVTGWGDDPDGVGPWGWAAVGLGGVTLAAGGLAVAYWTRRDWLRLAVAAAVAGAAGWGAWRCWQQGPRWAG